MASSGNHWNFGASAKQCLPVEHLRRVSMQVLTDVEQATPEWLTAALREAGVLDKGMAEQVEIDTSRPFGAIVAYLKVRYSSDAPMNAPSSLFLKVANPETHSKWPERGKREVEFYNAIPAADYSRLPVPRCYGAAFSLDGVHLLLENLADTNTILQHPFPPSEAQAEQVVDALAKIHAYWWNDKRLGVEMGRAAHQKTVFNDDENRFTAFADFLGEALWDERRSLFERVMAASSKLQIRLTKGNLTLIHGDAHAWNFLYPQQPEKSAVLVDWEAWDADVGIFDLAYLITLFWFPAHRARLEQKLVRRYYSKLVEYGVTDYGWDHSWYDYRHSIIRLLFRPIWWWHVRPTDAHWAEIWWPRLERVICAYEDLHCEELLA